MGGQSAFAKSWRRFVKKSLSPRLQRLEKEFEENGGEWRKVAVGDLFDIRPTKNYGLTNQKLFATKGDIPVVVNSSLNNGIGGYVNLEPTEKGNTITFSDTTTSDSIFYQPNDFIGYSHVQGMFPYGYWGKYQLLYFVISFRAATKGKFDYGNKFNRSKAKEIIVNLPYMKSELAFSYMENYIKALEAERIETLEAYLTVTGLKDYHLTEKDEQILDTFANLTDTKSRVEEWGSYTLNSLFEIFTGRDVIIGRTQKGEVPLVSHQHQNNGIVQKIMRLEDRRLFRHSETIALADRGVFLATTQVLDFHIGTRVKALKFKSGAKSTQERLFVTTSINKLQKLFTEYSANATDKLPDLKIVLPTNNNKIDYPFMSDFIKVIEKIVIKDLVEWTDKKIATTKEVVGHV